MRQAHPTSVRHRAGRRVGALAGALLLAGVPAAGCTHTVKVEPIEVRPMTLNINIKIDRELDEFFDFEQRIPPAPIPPATTAPTVSTPAPTPTPAPAPAPAPIEGATP